MTKILFEIPRNNTVRNGFERISGLGQNFKKYCHKKCRNVSFFRNLESKLNHRIP